MFKRYYSKVIFQRLREHTASNGPILVTGHTGFKGSWLGSILDYFEIDWIGYSLDEDSNWIHRNSDSQVEKCHIGDINDLRSLRELVDKANVSTLIHLAAKPLVQQAYIDPRDAFMTNIIGTSNVIQACLESKNCSVFGIVTTDKVYKNENTGTPFTESDQLWGNEPYSASKVGAEVVSDAWYKIAQASNKNCSFRLLRSGNVIGGGDLANDRIIPDLVRALTDNTNCKIRNPNHTRPWLHVLEPLTGYLLAIQDAIGKNDFKPYNFGPSEPSLSVLELSNIFNETINQKIRIEISNVEKGYESGLLELNSTKSYKELNWKPKYSQKHAVEITAKWWTEYLNKKLTVKDLIDRDIQDYFVSQPDD
jgi:CDP-glucose 4,6-dehydratase